MSNDAIVVLPLLAFGRESSDRDIFGLAAKSVMKLSVKVKAALASFEYRGT